MSDFTGLISPEFKQLHIDMITELIRGNSVPCLLYFGITRYNDCPNCQFNPIGNISSNRYETGGPSPFTTGVCPMCSGAGKIPDEQTESINLCPIYDYKSWIPTSVNVQSPDGFVQIISVFSTYENLSNAKEIIINTDITTNVRSRFEKHSEPEPCGLGTSSFISTIWKRIENV